MTLSASIKHRVPGRLRLQVEEDEFNQVRLQDAIQALRRSPNLRHVRGNALTRTIVLEAETEAELQSALDEVSAARVIEFRPHLAEPEDDSLRDNWLRLTKNTDRFLKDMSEGKLDLRTGVVVVLATLGLGQMTRGKFLPAGLTLLMYAAGLLELTSDPKKKK